MPLGNSGFRAAAGPARFQDVDDQDWDYYAIDVERDHGDTSYVFFQREFLIEDIPADLVGKKVGDIVKYDESTGTVLFEIGTNQHKYVLPNR